MLMSNKMMNGSADPIITVTLESPGEADLTAASLDPATGHFILNGVPLTSVNKSSASTKANRNFWIEMPQMIVVETRFITQQIAAQNHIYSAQTLLPITEDNRNSSIARKTYSQTSTQTAIPAILLDASTQAKPCFADASIITDGPNPFRDRGVQTVKTVKQSASIGVQCTLDDDFLEMHLNVVVPPSEDKLSEKQEFLMFTREKSTFYLNGRRECMICGEIEISMDRMLSHLSLHWGPSVLCHLCGIKFDHQILMSTHRCKMGGSKRSGKKKHKRNKQCPIFWCGSVTRSSQKLVEHLRQHSQMQRRRACVTFSRDKTMVLIRPIYTIFNSINRCNICLRKSNSSTKFIKHRRRCVTSFIARLKKH